MRIQELKKFLSEYLEEIRKAHYKNRNKDGDELIYDCAFLDGEEYLCYLLLDKIEGKDKKQ